MGEVPASLVPSVAAFNHDREILYQRLLPVLTFGGALLGALLFRHLGIRFLRRQSAGRSPFVGALLQSIRVPSFLWCIALALEVAIRYAALTEHQIQLASKGIVAFLIISFSLAAASISVRTIAAYGEKNEVPFAVAGLSRTLTRVFVLGIGALILLHHFSISITPVLTALGVGGLAVALALQDTLANFFAGVHILVEAPIGLGDFIKLSSGEEGVVKDIGWRTTRIITGSNNTVVVPNTKITSSILTNFSIPGDRVGIDIPIAAGLDADPDQIAELVMEIAHRTPGVLPEPPPLLLFDPGIQDGRMEFKLAFSVDDEAKRGTVASVLRASIFQAFRQNKIPLPPGALTAILRKPAE